MEFTVNENTERIIDKIRKVLELSKNNPSEEEARSAALKAQKLMMEYHISMVDLEDVGGIENIGEEMINVGTGNKWKYRLANIIAKNYRCKTYAYGSKAIVFYGYEADAKIAADVFQMLFKAGNRAATNYYNHQRNKAKRNGRYFNGAGMKNSYVISFADGVRSILEKQSTALMVVVPKEVDEEFEKTIGKELRYSTHTMNFSSDSAACQAGYQKGRSIMQGRAIAG